MSTYISDDEIWDLYTKVDPLMYKTYARIIEAKVAERVKAKLGTQAQYQTQNQTQGTPMETPTITIQYNSREEALIALKAPEYLIAAEDFRSYLRLKQKHDELTEDQAKTIEDISNAFHDIFEGLLPL